MSIKIAVSKNKNVGMTALVNALQSFSRPK
jgi:hypothetical protein